MKLQEITSHFVIYGDFVSAKSTGSGHINDTYIVSFNQAGKIIRYILRRINKFVFKQPEIVVKNSVNISNHIRNKLIAAEATDISRKAMTFIKALNNKYFYIDNDSNYWCMILFIEDSYSIDYVRNKDQSYMSAKAFANFQRLIIDANIDDYSETIPDFHNLPKRILAFDEAVGINSNNRLKNIKHELVVINKSRHLSDKYTELVNKKLPIRLTHNDTKINNVMLDSTTHEGLCVVDLDTVMPGTILNDFGDMVRTSTATVAEDEEDTSKVHINIEIFEALTRGYMEPLSDIITELETTNLVYGAKQIVFEQAIRFLTDYLLGDVYYTTTYPHHNLTRAKNQLALLDSIINHEIEMEEIVRKYAMYK